MKIEKTTSGSKIASFEKGSDMEGLVFYKDEPVNPIVAEWNQQGFLRGESLKPITILQAAYEDGQYLIEFVEKEAE